MEERPEATRLQPIGASSPHIAGAPTPEAEDVPAKGPRSGLSDSRRKLLTRGLIGGPVALAAMRPVKTLAWSHYCSFSGWQSISKAKTNHTVTSAAPKGTCTEGRTISHYSGGAHWPSSIKDHTGQNDVTLTSSGNGATTFMQLFGGNDAITLVSYLSGNLTQATFIAALFNAALLGGGYPFKVRQIYDIWKTPTLLGPGATQTDAAVFFNQLDVNP